jgi:hypothetical protein
VDGDGKPSGAIAIGKDWAKETTVVMARGMTRDRRERGLDEAGDGEIMGGEEEGAI